MGMENQHSESPEAALIVPGLPSHTASQPLTSARANGWTPERQRIFCETLAECGNVDMAAKAVGMTRQSAYRLRRRSEGRSFSLAWDAALKIARGRLMSEVIDLASEGISETIIKDGEIVAERRRRDPRILLTVIERLNKMEDRAEDRITSCVAQEFDEFLDCMTGVSGAEADLSPQAMSPADTKAVGRFLSERRPSSSNDYQGYLAFNRSVEAITGRRDPKAE